MALTGNHGIIIPRDRELLSHLYWQEEMGLPQMAQLFGVTHKSVERVMKELGIPTRPKGTSRHTRCIEVGCGNPVYKIRHAKNGSMYGKRCKQHRTEYRKKLPAHDLKRPEVRDRRNARHARWYYLGPLTIEGEQQWIQHARRLLRAAKRISVDPTQTPEALLSQKLASAQAQTSQT